MDELKFVLKCFVFAVLFLVLTQIRAGEKTLEGHIESGLVNSRVADVVNKVAQGGVRLINDTARSVKESYTQWSRPKAVSSNQEVKAAKITAGAFAAPVAHSQSDDEIDD